MLPITCIFELRETMTCLLRVRDGAFALSQRLPPECRSSCTFTGTFTSIPVALSHLYPGQLVMQDVTEMFVLPV